MLLVIVALTSVLARRRPPDMVDVVVGAVVPSILFRQLVSTRRARGETKAA